MSPVVDTVVNEHLHVDAEEEFMDWMWFALTLGLMGSVLCFFLGIIEAVSTAAIRPAPERPLAVLKAEDDQFKTIIAPAIAALISGLLVSLSAGHLMGTGGENDSWIGLVLFLAAMVALTATLRLSLGKNRKQLEFIRTPNQITAAAREAIENPFAPPLSCDELRTRLSAWTFSVGARSMGLERNAEAKALHSALKGSVLPSHASGRLRRWWRHGWSSLTIWGCAALRFPFDFGLPLCGVVALTAGLVGIHLRSDSPSLCDTLVLLLIGLLPVLFYIVMRGNRARRTYAVGLGETERATQSIDAAEKTFAAAVGEKTRNDALLARLESFLASSDQTPVSSPSPTRIPAEVSDDSCTLSLGRWRIELRRKEREI